MALKQTLNLRQTQRLALTPGLRQSLSVLALSAVDLAALAESEIAENPLLDWAEGSRRGSGGFDYAMDKVAAAPSLSAYLAEQIALSRAPERVRQMATYLAGNLTGEGYLAESPDAVAQSLGLQISLVDAAVALLQGCDPPGIGARGLADCLDIQLRALGEPDRTRHALLQNLEAFAASDWASLQSRTGLTPSELRRLRGMLQALTPFPAESFGDRQISYLTPDLKVTPDPSGTLRVDLVTSSLPVLEINHDLYQQTAAADPAADDYLRTHLARARALIGAIAARSKTLLRIAGEIAVSQHGFFVHGHDRMRPLTRADLAARIGIHPSTVSRAIANKSLECPHGVFALDFFFTGGLPATDGPGAHSAHAVRMEIRRMIEREPPEAPLSDAQIAADLHDSGVDISRRTVAKYRQCLKVPSSNQRRRSKKHL
ncbi:MAG: RNA polymerase factor sigma-54 [Rhodobacteraceae bacterium]|nr:RNA polymerase factor sigma-54 [Paracoccaceae bacterium]